MNRIARVIVDLSLDREFDYGIPDELRRAVRLGSRVVVPFGPRETKGYVVGLCADSRHKKLKSILSVDGDEPFIGETMLRLARWMSDYYCAPLEAAMRTVLPGAVRRRGAGFRMRAFVEPTGPVADKQGDGKRVTPQQAAVVELLGARGGMFMDELLGELEISESPVQTLAKRGLVTISRRPDLRNPLSRRNILATAPLELMPEQAEALALIVHAVDEAEVGGQGAEVSGQRSEVSGQRSEVGGQRSEVSGQRSEVGGQRAEVGGSGAGGDEHRTLNIEHRISNIATAEPPIIQSSNHPISQPTNHPIIQSPNLPTVERSRVVLLHGVTGSGKTEVYLQAIAHVLEKGCGAIVLVPEIALTPQTVERFAARFGEQIAVLHSHLSEGERHDEWHRIRDGSARVVIGARSAVFAPVRNLGLIVVDEEHEPSYKQEDVPRYNARDVAVVRGKMDDCVVVLGSATPALESWYNTRNGKYMLATLSHRADHRSMPRMHIVDLRLEAERTGKPGVFSRELIDAIGARLERAEQVILFLNRRGYATSLVCHKCGYVAGCDQCSVSYTYHRSDERLRCHICGADRAVPARCPECSDPSFKFTGIGTQRVEGILKKLFPQATVQRMDADVTTGKDAYDRILGDFRTGKTDILIGTQMIAKGLHFPNVTLVGVIYADLSLHIPDFRAGERTFQLLAQVAGRAGRGDVSGEVIVQTFTPHHWAVQAARRLDYEGLCDQEFAFREELSYPPFSHLACITLRGASQQKVEFSCRTLVAAINKVVSNRVTVSEACPAPLAKAKGRYRYQVMLRSRAASSITRPLKELLKEFRFPDDVRCSVDIDALSLL